jgi:hypothetical protein
MAKKLTKRKKYGHYRVFPNHQLINPFKEKPESKEGDGKAVRLLPHALFQIFTAKVIEVDKVYYR